MALAPTLCWDARTAGSGLAFTSWTGPVAIHHQVEVATPNCLRLYSVKELTGFTNGTGEKAGCNLPGRSVLPLNLGQTLNLLRLRQF